ncbi:MAG TPA: hypothetical protein GX714_13460 [Chloroflexi bacterium]|jgi:hypothetical protein|nr:hypothetical protein [Chloroflexota bacterium]
MNDTVGTILMALAVPVGWGLLSAWLFDRYRDWRQHGRERRQAQRDEASPEVAH